MHWTEYAAMVVVALVAVPFLILFCYFGAIAWIGLCAWWSPELPAQIGKHYPTQFGVFIRDQIYSWSATVQHRGRSITVSVDDDEGVPDQAALRMVPETLRQLEELEQAARRAVDELTPEMQLTTLSVDPGVSKAEVEVELSFARAVDGDETLFVVFVNGKFAGSEWLH